MRSLRELADSLQTDVVRVRSVDVTIRAVRESEAAVLGRMFPVPMAPRTRRDLSAGSNAPLLPDDTDPVYMAALADWKMLRMRLEVAVAAGLIAVLNTGITREQLEAAAAEVSNLVTLQELTRVYMRVAELGDLSDQRRAMEALVVDMREVRADDLAGVAEVPENYGRTLTAIDFRICERFGQAPWGTWLEVEPGFKALLRANERVRQAEEAREAAAGV